MPLTAHYLLLHQNLDSLNPSGASIPRFCPGKEAIKQVSISFQNAKRGLRTRNQLLPSENANTDLQTRYQLLPFCLERLKAALDLKKNRTVRDN